MNPVPPGVSRSPYSACGVETQRSLEDKIEGSVRALLPGASPDVVDDACRFLMKSVRLDEARRRREREPEWAIWATVVQHARKSKKDVERRLLGAGVSAETLDRLGGLYPLAKDLLREQHASAGLELDHGCGKCSHDFMSWERARGNPDGAAGPFCTVYGDIPAFCFDFSATRFCCDCGADISPEKVAETDPVGVQCDACCARDWAP